MSWLGDLWEKIRGSKTEDLILLSNLGPELEWVGQPMAPDHCYVELHVESLRLKHARKFASTFHGVVYSFVTLAREGHKNADLAAVSKPNQLATLDDSSLDKVITVSKKMMGAIPWRGGDFQLQLGLFSVKSGNLLSPVLDLVTSVSGLAGISFVGQVTPFIPLINKGMDLIAGQTKDTQLEVAVDTNIKLEKTGLYAIVDASKDKFEASKVHIDPIDMKLMLEGRPLDESYCIFSIRQTKQKADFGEIPELGDKFAAIQDAIRANDMQRAKDALVAFRLEAITSPDLIPDDATALVRKAEDRLRVAFAAGGMSAEAKEFVKTSLASLDIYG